VPRARSLAALAGDIIKTLSDFPPVLLGQRGRTSSVLSAGQQSQAARRLDRGTARGLDTMQSDGARTAARK